MQGVSMHCNAPQPHSKILYFTNHLLLNYKLILCKKSRIYVIDLDINYI
jgi:hypothetical protein